jgi:hypothetical protein
MGKMLLLAFLSLLAALTFNSLLELNAAKSSMAQRDTHGGNNTQVSDPFHTQTHRSLIELPSPSSGCIID